MKRVIFLLLNQLLLTSCEPGNFVENAGEWMEAGYKTMVRLGEEVEDVTVIEVRSTCVHITVHKTGFTGEGEAE